MKWLSTLIRYATTQGVVQVLQFATGLLIVRFLDKDNYAWYAMGVSVVAAVSVLAESGSNSALLSRGSAYLGDRPRLNSLFATALRFRLRFGIFVVAFGDALLAALLLVNDAPVHMVIGALLITSATLIPVFSKGVAQVHARLRRNYKLLQRVALISVGLRLLLVILIGSTSLAGTLSLLGVGFAAALFESWRLTRAARREIDFTVPGSDSDRRLLRKSQRQTLPMNVMLVAQGQLIFILLGIWASTEIVAEVSALSRFSLVFVVMLMAVTDIGSGIIASSPNNRPRLFQLFAGILGGYALLLTAIVALAALFAPFLIGLLGPQYSGLELPLVVVSIGAAATSASDALRTLNQARGWIRWSWLYLPFTVVWATLGLIALDVSTILGATILLATQAGPGLLTQGICFLAGIRKAVNRNA